MSYETIEGVLGYGSSRLSIFNRVPQNKDIQETVKDPLSSAFSEVAALWTGMPFICKGNGSISCAEVSADKFSDLSDFLEVKEGAGENRFTLAVNVDSNDSRDKFTYFGLSTGVSVFGFSVESLNSEDPPVRKINYLHLDRGGNLTRKEITGNDSELELFREIVRIAISIKKEEWTDSSSVCRTGSA